MNWKNSVTAVALAVLIGPGVGVGSAAVLDLYETVDNTPGGILSEVGPPVDVSAFTGSPGPFTVVMMECSSCQQSNRANWSDFILFDAGDPQFARLWSDGAAGFLTQDVGTALFFVNESTTSSVTFIDLFSLAGVGTDGDLVAVHSDASELPEPGTLLLLGAALVGMTAGRRWLRKRSA